ncbi:CCN family member 2-like [Anguilla anguilla]|uniref:CCN family member 2 n=1 Tax=Anguilla anguilla TaxID=7936 RepID=A0A9D3SAA4_ANGAN|nr:CCN family member 2-like [Anguilla anguilla]KAG5857231.1 hypothetical protein ANANG_G00017180 [Anguilla anguilla]
MSFGMNKLSCFLCFSFFYWTSALQCSGQCSCPSTPPQCSPGVSLVPDVCGCCRVCAKQEGEVCSERDVCDPHKGLHCDFTSSVKPTTGVCIGKEGAKCVFKGVVYRSGESFQSSCKYQCTCLNGAVGCVHLCGMNIRLSSPDCPSPRRVKVPGKCCEEWVCDPIRSHHSFLGPALAAYREEETYGQDDKLSRGNCLLQATEWSACSKTCGMGVSTRVTNDNSECRLEKQSRLCMSRPCGLHMEQSLKNGKKCLRSFQVSRPMMFEFSGCRSVKSYRPNFCGGCTDGRCCAPHKTATLPVEFKCPGGQVTTQQVMFIKTCSCHHNCPGDNDVFTTGHGGTLIDRA